MSCKDFGIKKKHTINKDQPKHWGEVLFIDLFIFCILASKVRR